MKIQIQSSLGVITSDEITTVSKEELWSFARKAAAGESEFLRFNVNNNQTYLPKNILINSIITVIK